MQSAAPAAPASSAIPVHGNPSAPTPSRMAPPMTAPPKMAMFHAVTIIAWATSAAGPAARADAVRKSVADPPKASPQISAAP